MSCRRRSFRVSPYVFPAVRVHNAFDDRENIEAFTVEFIPTMFRLSERGIDAHYA